jgi:mRNA interferase HigB
VLIRASVIVHSTPDASSLSKQDWARSFCAACKKCGIDQSAVSATDDDDVILVHDCYGIALLLKNGSVSLLMHVITRKRLNEFADEYPEARTALAHWYGSVKRTSFSSFEQLKSMFSTADRVGKLTVFNVGGNKVRVITAIHYNRKRIYIRAVLTHDEYDRDKWKE